MGKFKMINGVMVDTSKVNTSQVVPMAIVTTPEELAEVSMEYGSTVAIPTATAVAIEKYTDDPTFTAKFQQPGLNYEQMLDQLSVLFARYEVPIGLLAKLCALSDYSLSIVIDDSGSMGDPTDSLKSGAYTDFMKQYYKDICADLSKQMTRWEEEEDRLHLMIDFLAYIPTGPITVICMNRTDQFTLVRAGKTPQDFLNEGHSYIRRMFTKSPAGGTPTMRVMQQSLNNAVGLTSHYLFTDGVPKDCSTDDLGRYLAHRPNAQANPLTFVSCTNVDEEAEWMKEIEEIGPYMAEVDDYEAELREVRHDQGPTFPYSKGLWIMCLLVGALNPHDLDAMDDSRPFTKFTLENVMGRGLTPQEYSKYWSGHPKSREYDYNRFATEQRHAAELIKTDSVTRKSMRFMSGVSSIGKSLFG
jgi:hypothetical protein